MNILMVAYDNGSYMTWFPQGLAYLASACLKEGHQVEIYQQDIFHWTDAHLTKFLDGKLFDIVIVSVIGGYYQYQKLLKLSEAINASINRNAFKYLIGGHGPSASPEYFLKKTGADFVGIGEGEITIVELIDAIENKKDYEKVDGIAFMKEETYVLTKERALIENIDEIDFPAYELFDMNYYALMRAPNISATDRCLPVLSGRGCTFSCNFCYRMDKGFRPRSSEAIIKEIRFLQEAYNINYIYFSDELLMNSKERTIELCNAFNDAELNIKWVCNGRLNYATTEVLTMMKAAGCVFINYGIESMDNDTLKIMHKALTTEMIIKGVENTISAGISPGLNIIFGNIDEPIEVIEKNVEFLLKYDDHSQLRTIRPVTPYPGSELFNIAIEKGYLKDVEDFYENKHNNSDLISVNFTKNSDEEIHQRLYEANMKLIERYIENTSEKYAALCKDLYINQNVDFRGFRQT